MKRFALVFGCLLLVGAGLALVGFGLALGQSRGGLALGDAVLEWRISGSYPERPSEGGPFPGFGQRSSFAAVYRALRAARTDGSVRGLAVTIDGAGFGLAQAQEVRRQFLAISAAGKGVDCYLDTVGEGQNGTLDYYLASACDQVVVAPSGEFNLLGLAFDTYFLRGALDKLRIEPQFHHQGRFKSASETYTERQHTPAAREALNAVLDGFFAQVVAGVAAGRELEEDTVRAAFEASPMDLEAALAAGFIDQLAYPDEFKTRLDTKYGSTSRRGLLSEGRAAPLPAGKRVAVLFADGAIVRGKGGSDPWSGESALGSAALTQTLRELAEDESIASVVLRVDSPGGSALASDLILREVDAVKAKKPVVASFSNLAASGGYYIATKASRIVAEAGSITGSIGVVSGKLVTRRFQEELLGITDEVLKRGSNADFYFSNVPFSAEQEVVFERQMGRVYNRFVGHVAAGRGMAPDEVEAVAQGRVWTGEDAKRHGLVDELGGLDRAIELAAELGGVSGARVSFYPAPTSFWETLLRGAGLPDAVAELRSRLAVLGALSKAPAGALELPAEARRLASPF